MRAVPPEHESSGVEIRTHQSDFDAALYQATERLVDYQPKPCYCISMNVGSAVAYRAGARSRRRYEVARTITIVPPNLRVLVPYKEPALLLNALLSRHFVCSVAAQIGLNPDDVAIKPRPRVYDPQMEHVLWAIKDGVADSSDPPDAALGESLGVVLAMQLLRRYSHPHVSPDGRENSERIQAVLEYINRHLDAALSLQELADVGCFSLPNLKLLFRNMVGTTTHRYVLERRVAHAISLLKNSEAPLKEVAVRAGFYDQSHMTRWIQRIAGSTPTKVRNLERGV